MATEHDPKPDSPRPVVTPAQPVRPEEFLKVSTTREPEPSGGGGFGTVLMSALVALLAGGGGAWAYLNYIHPELARRQAPAEPQAAAPAEDQSSGARLEALTRRLDDLQTRVEKLPKPSELPDLEPVNQKLAVVDDLSRKLEAQRTRFGTLPEKIDENARKITAMMADLNGVRNEISTMRSDVQSNKAVVATMTSAEKPAGAKPADTTNAKPAEDDFGRGVDQFQKKQYKEATDTFTKLTQAQPDDARAWYYAALARGFATGNWKGETERLVNEGLDRERAGKPDKAKIDSTFYGLTTETGKDWLAYYRRRAASTDRAAR